jgi:DNA-binding NarL/FixJ family response regulator
MKLKVVAELEGSRQLNEVCLQFQPDYVRLDLTISEPDAITSLSILKKGFPNIKVILSAMHDNDLRILEGIRAGALGSILKTSLPEEFINAVYTVHNSRYLLSSGIAGKLLSTLLDIDDLQDERDKLRQLSNREQLVLRELVKGSTTKKISQDLNINIKTVNQYVSALFRKLNVSDRVQLVLYGIKNNLNG